MSDQISRNAPCPCGSGKRYKHCHGSASPADEPGNRIVPDAGDDFIRAQGLHQSGQLDEAELAYLRLLDIHRDHAQALHYLGVIQYQRKDYPGAEKYIRAALSVSDAIPMAYNNMGLALKEQDKPHEALACYDKAIGQAPDNAVAYNNRGLLLCDLKQYDEALASCAKAISLRPDFAEAYANHSKALFALSRHEEAFQSCDRALSLAANLPYVTGHWLHSKMQCCDWNGLDAAYARVLGAVDRGDMTSVPFPILAIPSSPAQQQACARTLVRDQFPTSRTPLWQGERYQHDRIRVGYLSADFRNHPLAQLIAEMIERHDRSRFEIIAISFGPATDDPWRRRLEKSFDRFFDVATQTDQQIAALVRELEIDIAIDLSGHTHDSRIGVFSQRPAPLHVNYLGYPATMGADYFDYIIADHVLIPPEHRPYFDEKIVYLPDTYQVNDTTKAISDHQFTRAELGLPEDAFVFCCFNNNYKTTPDLFDIWMRLLHEVDRSVLWLLVGNPAVIRNLRLEAGKRGIDPDRLIFAPRMDLADHLARHRQADLFLDTFYYNAHTTASDALWAGLPVVTRLGDSFAGRVAASILHAVGLPELIAKDAMAYESLALALATSPERLSAIRMKLALNIATQPLFDAALFTRNIEAAFSMMLARHEGGLPPDHLIVEPLKPASRVTN